jgi:hypothetical protein
MMPCVRPEGLAEVIEVFGDPHRYVSAPEVWEAETLRIVQLSQPLIYAIDTGLSISRVRAHRYLVEHLAETLMTCLDAGVPPGRMKYGGCYCWRTKRSGHHLSLHAWGIAVDLEPTENPYGEPWRDDGIGLDPRVIDTFRHSHWKWGGEFTPPDPMHFQWATEV